MNIVDTNPGRANPLIGLFFLSVFTEISLDIYEPKRKRTFDPFVCIVNLVN